MHAVARSLVTVVAVGLMLAGAAGCDPCSFSAGFVSGWLAGTGKVFGATQTICFHNGVQVDCGSLPANLGQ